MAEIEKSIVVHAPLREVYGSGLDSRSLAPDNLLHVLLGVLFLFAGAAVASPRSTSPITRLNL